MPVKRDALRTEVILELHRYKLRPSAIAAAGGWSVSTTRKAVASLRESGELPRVISEKQCFRRALRRYVELFFGSAPETDVKKIVERGLSSFLGVDVAIAQMQGAICALRAYTASSIPRERLGYASFVADLFHVGILVEPHAFLEYGDYNDAFYRFTIAANRAVKGEEPFTSVHSMDELVTAALDMHVDVNRYKFVTAIWPDNAYEIIDELLQTLRPQEELTMRLLYGIGCEKSRTVKELGMSLDPPTTYERTHKLIVRVKRLLRHPSRAVILIPLVTMIGAQQRALERWRPFVRRELQRFSNGARA
ncbi:MAG: hypothetical protein ABIG71_03900 [Candidatus Uhrbacteria bacterium]